MADNSGSAFPHAFDEFDFAPGLTKRELFAAMAMQGMLANKEMLTTHHDMPEAVQMADALLKELSKEKSE